MQPWIRVYVLVGDKEVKSVSFLFNKQKRIVFSRKVKGFWEEFSHNKIGLVGLALIFFYVFLGIAAPLLTQHSPSRDWGLASGWAMPAWVTIFPQFSNYPRTMEPSLNWVVAQDSELVNITLDEGLMVEYSGSQEATVLMQSSFAYDYEAPKEFFLDYEWQVETVGSEYIVETSLVSPMGVKYMVWNSYYDRSIWPVFESINISSTPVAIRSDALRPNIYKRLGLPAETNVAQKIFIESGDFKWQLKIILNPLSEGTARISITDVKFTIPGLVHGIMGTDHIGGDIWSQLVWGTQISLAVGLTAALLSTSIGILVGIIAGFSGGVVDEVLMRLVDILLCLPVLPLLLGFFMLWGPNVFYLVILIAVFGWQGLSRMVRSQVLYLKEMPFIECSRAAGARKAHIMLKHLLPNVLPVALAALVLSVPAAILTEAALSFIGFGDPLVPTWGRMLNHAFNYGAFRFLSWHWILPPGIALTTLTLSFVFVGHAVDEIVNPRLRRRR